MRIPPGWLVLSLLIAAAGCYRPSDEGSDGGGTTGGGSSGAASSGGGSGGGGACGGTSCEPGTTCCGTACRDLQTDTANCGACGNVCPQGQICSGSGGCVAAPCAQGTGCFGGIGCCGAQCCTSGQVCCLISGPVDRYGCLDADAGCGIPCTKNCPISSRRYKKDIDYLTDADRERLRDDLVRLPLATFRYKTEPESARARLGFMVEDATSPACVAPPGDRVDLYGYATMAVAALQAQQKELDALRAEVERLRARVGQGGETRTTSPSSPR